MKCEIIDTTDLPGSFLLTAETPAECLLLRIFATDPREILIANHGGNIERHEQSLTIAHKVIAKRMP